MTRRFVGDLSHGLLREFEIADVLIRWDDVTRPRQDSFSRGNSTLDTLFIGAEDQTRSGCTCKNTGKYYH